MSLNTLAFFVGIFLQKLKALNKRALMFFLISHSANHSNVQSANIFAIHNFLLHVFSSLSLSLLHAVRVQCSNINYLLIKNLKNSDGNVHYISWSVFSVAKCFKKKTTWNAIEMESHKMESIRLFAVLLTNEWKRWCRDWNECDGKTKVWMFACTMREREGERESRMEWKVSRAKAKRNIQHYDKLPWAATSCSKMRWEFMFLN